MEPSMNDKPQYFKSESENSKKINWHNLILSLLSQQRTALLENFIVADLREIPTHINQE